MTHSIPVHADYSLAYWLIGSLILHTVVQAAHSLSRQLIGVSIEDITSNFASWWRKITSEPQLRWVGQVMAWRVSDAIIVFIF